MSTSMELTIVLTATQDGELIAYATPYPTVTAKGKTIGEAVKKLGEYFISIQETFALINEDLKNESR